MTCTRIIELKEPIHFEGTPGERNLKHLSELYHFKVYISYVDNYFIELLYNLLLKDTFACGTFRINKKH